VITGMMQTILGEFKTDFNREVDVVETLLTIFSKKRINW
jgi:ribosomal protein S17E